VASSPIVVVLLVTRWPRDLNHHRLLVLGWSELDGLASPLPFQKPHGRIDLDVVTSEPHQPFPALGEPDVLEEPSPATLRVPLTLRAHG
jgi:hypothetical protein